MPPRWMAPFCPAHNTRMVFEIVPGERGPTYRYKCLRFPECDFIAYAGRKGHATSAPGNASTRAARNKAHKAFDPLWQGKGAQFTQSDAYDWLRRRMHLSPAACHIGLFNEEQCQRLIDLVQQELLNRWRPP